MSVQHTCLMIIFCGGGFFWLSWFPPFSLSCHYICFGISCIISTGKVQEHQKMSYDSKTGWAPIRCVICYFARSPENFCGFFSSNLPGDLAPKKRRRFLVNFFGSLSPTKRNTNTPQINWGIILKPQPPHTRQNMNTNMAPKLSSLPRFEAFWAVFCPKSRCLFIFLPCMWGAGATRAFLIDSGKTREKKLRIRKIRKILFCSFSDLQSGAR